MGRRCVIPVSRKSCSSAGSSWLVSPTTSPGSRPPTSSGSGAHARCSPVRNDPAARWAHDGRPYSESGWVPPRRPKVFDQSVVSVKYEGWEQKRYGPGGLKLPDPRDNGTPGPSSERPSVVRVDPESGMPIEERHGRPWWARPQSHMRHAAPRNRWQWLQLLRRDRRLPRHLGSSRRMLVTCTPLIDLVPTERATMPGRVVTQYDKEDIEALGLVKIDLLSLRTLGVVSECLDKIERDTGQRIDLDQLPHDDPEVFKTIRAADTVGMFQIESRAQMQALPKSRPERFEDLVVQVAIIRPGPIQGNAVHPYLRRRAGQEPVTYLHPSLEPILSDTLGVILYQEQVMQIAIEVCGYTALEADIFRKAMGSHRSHQKMQAERDRFVGGAMRTGLSEEDGEDLFKRCSAFAEFGFARAHAAAFAKITYDTAWLKQRYPATTTPAS
jgi:error-prone DNA polymerase